MPEAVSLHPLDPDLVARFAAAVAGTGDARSLVPSDPAWGERTVAAARRGYERARRGDELGANTVSFALAQVLATAHPTFLAPSAGLTIWEARIDRGVGMLLRPPSRLFGEAGLDLAAARAMPIRLDLGLGTMGGSHVPARLVPDLRRLIEERTVRLLRRLDEAELDPVATLGLMIDAVAYAAERGLGLYEALDVITLEAPEADPPGARLVAPDRRRLDPALRRRLEEAAKPPKRPGLLARLAGRRGPSGAG
jgi:hypothetical protein